MLFKSFAAKMCIKTGSKAFFFGGGGRENVDVVPLPECRFCKTGIKFSEILKLMLNQWKTRRMIFSFAFKDFSNFVFCLNFWKIVTYKYLFFLLRFQLSFSKNWIEILKQEFQIHFPVFNWEKMKKINYRLSVMVLKIVRKKRNCKNLEIQMKNTSPRFAWIEVLCCDPFSH